MDSKARFQLLSAFDRLKRISHRTIPGHKLHGPEFFVMDHIQMFCGTENGIEVSRLRLGASRPAVSQMLNNLEKKGFIERSIAPDDRRKVIVKITGDGEKALSEMKMKIDKLLDTLIERLGENDFNDLLRLMSRLEDIIKDIEEENKT